MIKEIKVAAKKLMDSQTPPQTIKLKLVIAEHPLN